MALVRTQRDPSPDASRGEKVQSAVPLAGATGMADVYTDDQAMTVLHQAVSRP